MANLLESLYEEMYGPLDSPGKIKNLAKLSKALARAVNRKTPWTSHHLNAVLMGYKGFVITHDLEVAINALFAIRDAVNPLQVQKVEVHGFSINGKVQSGSIFLGESKHCKGCGILIVPRVPWQEYCDKKCPSKYKAKLKIKCAVCGEFFLPRSASAKYCPAHSWSTPEGRKYQRERRAKAGAI